MWTFYIWTSTGIMTSVPANFSTAVTYGNQNTNTNGTECHEEDANQWITTVVPVYVLIISVLGIVFNMFVLMVFCLHKKSCTVAEIYLSNLAAADLILVSCLPFWAVNILKNFNWPFGRVLCKVVNLGIKMNIYCSIYFLVLVSIDRYVALVQPLSHYRLRRPKYAKLSCVLVWGLGFLLGIPTLIYRTVEYNETCNTYECYINYTKTEFLVFEGMLIIFSFIIPIFIISFCTVKILQALNNRLTEGSNSQKNEHKATTLVLAVLLIFLICWSPFHLAGIVEMLMRAGISSIDETILDICMQIFVYFAFFNSVLNPILYVIVGKNFRKKVTEVCWQLGSGETSISMSSTRTHLSRSVKSVNVAR